jgi:hypothetical protein
MLPISFTLFKMHPIKSVHKQGDLVSSVILKEEYRITAIGEVFTLLYDSKSDTEFPLKTETVNTYTKIKELTPAPPAGAIIFRPVDFRGIKEPKSSYYLVENLREINDAGIIKAFSDLTSFLGYARYEDMLLAKMMMDHKLDLYHIGTFSMPGMDTQELEHYMLRKFPGLPDVKLQRRYLYTPLKDLEKYRPQEVNQSTMIKGGLTEEITENHGPLY